VVQILTGNCREILLGLEAESVDCCVTSPPYWGLRDYGVPGQIGLEASAEEYVDHLAVVFDQVHRVLKPSGSLWLNLGDCYAGASGGYQGKNGQRGSRTFTARIAIEKGGVFLKRKDLVGIPWRVAFTLQAAGWWLRSPIIWAKPNPMPESVTDRPTMAHEYIFLLTKSDRYWYDAKALAEPAISRLQQRLTPTSEQPKGRLRTAAGVQNPKCQGGTGRLEAGGKHGEADPNAKGRRMSASTATACARGAEHDSPFGPTRNIRTVWTIPTAPYTENHFATFPTEIPRRCILGGCPRGGVVLDPFAGTGTVGQVAEALGRHAILIELNPAYCDLARGRTDQPGLLHGSGLGEEP
jgi:DNA modification methylase